MTSPLTLASLLSYPSIPFFFFSPYLSSKHQHYLFISHFLFFHSFLSLTFFFSLFFISHFLFITFLSLTFSFLSLLLLIIHSQPSLLSADRCKQKASITSCVRCRIVRIYRLKMPGFLPKLPLLHLSVLCCIYDVIRKQISFDVIESSRGSPCFASGSVKRAHHS